MGRVDQTQGLIVADYKGSEAKVFNLGAARWRQSEGRGRVTPVPACAYRLSSGLYVCTGKATIYRGLTRQCGINYGSSKKYCKA